MEKTDLSNGHNKLQQVRELALPTVGGLPFELLNRRTNKTTKLVANSGDDTPMNGSNRWFAYEFSEPVFLCEVVVSIEKYGSYDSFEFQWEIAGGGKSSKVVTRESDTLLRISINQLVTAVAFRPPKKWLTDPIIKSVSLKGFEAGEIEDFAQTISRLERLRSDVLAMGERAVQNAEEANEKVERLRLENDDLKAEITSANSALSDLHNQIGRLTEERNAIQADIKKRQSTISDLHEQETQVGERIAERNAHRTALAKEIADQKQELRSLQNDINMFPTEISGFVTQAAQNAQSYWKLASVPIAIIVIVTILLIFNAANLTTVVDENDNARIFSILVTRLPYVIIATAIVGAAYKLAALLVSEIMRINQQKLNLSKISIIATDISDASADGLSQLSGEELWQLKTRLKMDMLRDHMKAYLSRDYQPTARASMPKVIDDKDERVEDETGNKDQMESAKV